MPKTAAAAAEIAILALRAESGVRGDELPERLCVAPWGTHDIGARGQAVVNDATACVFAENMQRLKRGDHVCLDFNHNSLPGHQSYLAEKEPRKIAASGKPEIVPGKGIFLTGLTWTPEGADAFKGGHFQDISPTVYRDKAGTVIALHSAALCQHGEIDGLTIPAAVQAALSAEIAALSADSPSLATTTTTSMKPTPELIALLAALGVTLDPAADEATTTKALTDLTTKIKADAAEDKAEMSTTAMTALNAIEVRLKTVETERDTMKRDRLKEQAIAAGKVIPLTDEQWNATALSTCEALVAGLKPGVVPMKKGNGAAAEISEDPTALSAEDELVCQRMGISKEDFLKSKTKAAA